MTKQHLNQTAKAASPAKTAKSSRVGRAKASASTRPAQASASTPTKPDAKPTNATRLLSLLSGKRAVPLCEITIAFGWQPHSARAAISGLRKAGHVIETSKADDGSAAYQVARGKQKTPILAKAGDTQ